MIRLEMTLAMVRVMALELWRDRAALVMTFLLPPLVFLIFSSVFLINALGSVVITINSRLLGCHL